MAVGSGREAFAIEGGEIENMKEFPYLDSLIAERQKWTTVSEMYMYPRLSWHYTMHAVFKNAYMYLSISTKRKV